MTLRRLAMLGAVALATIAAAAWLSYQRQTPPDDGYRTAVVPELAGRIDALTEIRVVAPGNAVAVTLRRNGPDWVVAERGGYPADAARLRRFVLALADLKTRELKTRDPALYPRLGVEDVAAPAAQGVRVELAVPGSNVRLIVGKDATTTGTYVRRDGDPQSLEAAPPITVERDAKLWLERRLLSLDSRRVRRIEVTPFSGRPYSIVRDDPGQADFRLVGVPAGRKPYNPSAANPQAQALAPLEFDDVRRSAEVDLANGSRGRVVYHTFDGLVLTLDAARAGGKSWLQLQAAFDPAGAVPSGGSPEARAEAESLARRTAGWTYELPAYRLDGLLRPVEDFLGS